MDENNSQNLTGKGKVLADFLSGAKSAFEQVQKPAKVTEEVMQRLNEKSADFYKLIGKGNAGLEETERLLVAAGVSAGRMGTKITSMLAKLLSGAITLEQFSASFGILTTSAGELHDSLGSISDELITGVSNIKLQNNQLGRSVTFTERLLQLAVKYSNEVSNITDTDTDRAKLISKMVGDAEKFGGSTTLSHQLQEDIENLQQDATNMFSDLSKKKFKVSGDVHLSFTDAAAAIEKQAVIQKKRIDKSTTDMMQSVAEGLVVNIKGYKLDESSGNILDTAKNIATDGMIQSQAEEYKKLLEVRAESELREESLFKTMTEQQKAVVLMVREQKKQNTVQSQSLAYTKQGLVMARQYRPIILSAGSAVDSMNGALVNMVDTIPKGVRQILGLDTAVENVTAESKKMLEVFNKKLIQTGSLSTALGSSFSGYLKALKSSVGIFGGIMLIAAAVVKSAFALKHEWEEVASSMTISVSQAKKLFSINKQIVTSNKNRFVDMKAMLDIQKQYLAVTGNIEILRSREGQAAAENLSLVSQAYAMTSETTVDSFQKFQQLGADISKSQKLVAGLASEAQLAGFSSELVSKEMIENADMLATYFGGYPEDAAAAVIEVKKLGMNLKQVDTIMNKAMNIEGFLTDMYELQAMGGPDLSKVFDKAIEGDVAGVANELMRATGGLEQFSKMDRFQKMKIASTVGMTVDELTKAMTLEQKIAGLSEKNKEYARSHSDILSGMTSITDKQLAAKIEEEDVTRSMAATWNNIKTQFAAALLPASLAFLDAIKGVSKLAPVIQGSFGLISGIVGGIATVIGAILSPIDTISKLFKNTEESTGGMAATMSGTVSTIGKILGGMFALKMVFGGTLSMAGKLVSTFTSAGSILGKLKGAAASAGGGVGGVVKSIGTSVMDKVKSLIPTGASTAVDKVKGSLVDKLKEKVTRKFSGTTTGGDTGAASTVKRGKTLIGSVMTSLDEFTKKIPSIAKSLVQTVTGIAGELLKGISTAAKHLPTIATSIGKVFTQLAGTIMSGLSKAASHLPSIAKSIGSALGSFLSGITTGITTFAMAMAAPTPFFGVPVGLVFVGMAMGIAAALRIAAPAIAQLGGVFTGIGTVIEKTAGGVATVIKQMADSILQLSGVNPLQLYAVAGGIGSMSIALASLGTGSLISGVGSAIGTLFGGDIISKLSKFGELSEPIDTTATSMVGMKDALSEIMTLSKGVDTIGVSFNALASSIERASEALAAYGKGNNRTSGVANNAFSSLHSEPGTLSQTSLAYAKPTPPTKAAAQHLSIGDIGTGTKNDSPLLSNGNLVVDNASLGGGVGNVNAMTAILNKIYVAIVDSNNRPISINFDDGTVKYLNNRGKALNNRR